MHPLLRSLATVSSFVAVGCTPTDPGPAPAPDGGPTSPASYLDDDIQRVLNLPGTAYAYSPSLPAHFTSPAVVALDNTPPENTRSDEGATLGRVLFYDASLSANGTIACASCHRQGASFSDPAIRGLGFEGGETGRHSMNLVEVRYDERGAMFWDERAATLEEQVLRPIQDATEMGMTIAGVRDRLEATAHDPKLFENAFGDPAITEERLARALAQFVRSLVSGASRYDQGHETAAGDVLADFTNFTDQENRGKELFFLAPPQGGAGCAACHVNNPPPGAPGDARNLAVFLMSAPRNNGLTASLDGDPGVGGVTGRTQDVGLFKSPSLRNVAVGAPYMHDGSIASLRAVVDHYDHGVEAHPNLDPILRDGPGGPPRRLGLSEADLDALVAFLETLTDEVFLTDERFGSPYRE